jgi:hypothetical protein
MDFNIDILKIYMINFIKIINFIETSFIQLEKANITVNKNLIELQKYKIKYENNLRCSIDLKEELNLNIEKNTKVIKKLRYKNIQLIEICKESNDSRKYIEEELENPEIKFNISFNQKRDILAWLLKEEYITDKVKYILNKFNNMQN